MIRWRQHLPLMLLVLAVAFVVAARIQMLTIPLERDEGEFAYAGQLMLEGIPPYKLFYNMKAPGIYAAYAAIMAVFGQTDRGIHLGLLFVNLGGIFLIYRLARRFFDSRGAAVAGATYAVLSTSAAVLGFSTHATHFVVAAALAGLLLLWRGQATGKSVWVAASGAMFGLACLMKQPGAVFGAFGFLMLAERVFRDQSQRRRHVLRLALFAAGFAAPLLLTALLMWWCGVFGRFWFWAFTYASEHASEVTFTEGVGRLRHFFTYVSPVGGGLLWMVAGVGLVSLPWASGDGRKAAWLAAFLVFSLAAVSLSYYFSSHYFVMLLPVLSLLAAQAVTMSGKWLRWAAAPGLIFGLLWVQTAWHEFGPWFGMNPEKLSRKIYGGNPFIESREIGRQIREHSSPDARIAVFGSEPELFFYAHRHSATGYIYMYDLTVPQPFAGEMQREMMDQVEGAKPEFVVFFGIPASWDLRTDFSRTSRSDVFQWSGKFVLTYYDPAGLCLVENPPRYFWGGNAMANVKPQGPFVSIFTKK